MGLCWRSPESNIQDVAFMNVSMKVMLSWLYVPGGGMITSMKAILSWSVVSSGGMC